jgi:hypothetical protein
MANGPFTVHNFAPPAVKSLICENKPTYFDFPFLNIFSQTITILAHPCVLLYELHCNRSYLPGGMRCERIRRAADTMGQTDRLWYVCKKKKGSQGCRGRAEQKKINKMYITCGSGQCDKLEAWHRREKTDRYKDARVVKKDEPKKHQKRCRDIYPPRHVVPGKHIKYSDKTSPPSLPSFQPWDNGCVVCRMMQQVSHYSASHFSHFLTYLSSN